MHHLLTCKMMHGQQLDKSLMLSFARRQGVFSCYLYQLAQAVLHTAKIYQICYLECIYMQFFVYFVCTVHITIHFLLLFHS